MRQIPSDSSGTEEEMRRQRGMPLESFLKNHLLTFSCGPYLKELLLIRWTCHVCLQRSRMNRYDATAENTIKYNYTFKNITKTIVLYNLILEERSFPLLMKSSSIFILIQLLYCPLTF